MLKVNSTNGGAVNTPGNHTAPSSTELEDGPMWESQKSASDTLERNPLRASTTGGTPVVPVRFATVGVSPIANASNAQATEVGNFRNALDTAER